MDTSLKTCFKCQQLKPLDEFYKHPMMGDGHLGKCKECAKVDVRINRRVRLEYYSLYDAMRARLPKRKELRLKVSERRKKEVPGYKEAHYAVTRAVRGGLLKKEPCQMCGSTKFIHAHHDDYEQPLAVMWLCPAHHKARHAFLEYFGFETYRRAA